jgi:hypothetical protein
MTIFSTNTGSFERVTVNDTTNTTSYLDGAVTVAGGMSIQKDLRISGSMTINGLLTVVSMSSQYVTSSQYNVGVSKITVNDDDNVRFAGFSVFDSGSSSPTTASIYWDSLQHRFLYENLSGSAYNSAILIAGPKNTGSLGSETGLTSGYITYATGEDHIDNSIIFQNQSNIGIGTTNPANKLQIGSTASGYAGNDLVIGNGTEVMAFYNYSGGPSTWFTNTNFALVNSGAGSTGNVGIGTTNPQYKLDVYGGGNTTLRISGASNGYTQGRLVIQSGTTDSPEGRGLGVYLFNEGTDVTWYFGTGYGAGDAFVINRKTGTTLQDPAASPAESSGFFRIKNNGNVGIGTDDPGYKLDVYNVGGSVATTRLYGNDQTNVRLRLENIGSSGRTWELVGGLPGANNSNFSIYDVTGTATRLTIDSSGNVGVGEANPAAYGRFTVTSSGIGVHVNSTSGAGGINFYEGGSGRFSLRTLNGTAGLSFYDTFNSVERVRIDASGNLGLGVTPKSWYNGYGIKAMELSGGSVFGGTNSLEMAGNAYYSSADVFKRKNAAPASLYQMGGTHIWSVAGTGTADSNITFTQAMTLDASGNLGVGTTSPDAKLQVVGTTFLGADGAYVGVGDPRVVFYNANNTETSTLWFQAGVGSALAGFKANDSTFYITNTYAGNALGTNGIAIGTGGNVGIGTTSPNAPLQFATSTATRKIVLYEGANNNYQFYGFGVESATLVYSTYTTGDDHVFFAGTGASSRSELMRIKGSGNVGVGTTSPVEKLEVNGTNVSVAVYDNGMAVGGNRTRLKLGYNNNYNAGLSGYVASGQPGVDRVSLGFHVTTYTTSVQTFYEAMTLTDVGHLLPGAN